MPQPKLDTQLLIDALNLAEEYGSAYLALKAGATEISRSTLEGRVREARVRGLQPTFRKDAPRVYTRQRLGRMHCVIPDVQSKPGVRNDHMTWVGNYIAEKRPDVVVCIGDFWDMESLSIYDKGKLPFEGRRYVNCVKAGRVAMEKLLKPIEDYNRTAREKYTPEMHFTLGNHEERIIRLADNNPEYEGKFCIDDLGIADYGWTVHDFLKVVKVDGIEYSHYFTSGVRGNATSSAAALLRERQCSATMGHVQHTDIAMHKKTQQIAMFCGTCFTPDHKVLTADLRYVPLATISVGDKLVSFDEKVTDSPGRSRRYKTGTVNAVRFAPAEVFAVTLSNGKVFKVTGDHLWLTRVGGPAAVREGASYRWRTTTQLRRGTRIPQPLDEWEPLDTYEAGWLAGVLDGEGCLWTLKGKPHAGMQLGVSQKEGPVLERVRRAMATELGLATRTETYDKAASTLRVRGGLPAVARVLGMLRPTRLLPKFSPEMLGRMTTKRNHRVVAIEPLGTREIVQLDIDAKTMVVEGTPQHNCYLHDERYLGRQDNCQRRQIVIKHEVADGRYDPMFVSLKFLEKGYA